MIDRKFYIPMHCYTRENRKQNFVRSSAIRRLLTLNSDSLTYFSCLFFEVNKSLTCFHLVFWCWKLQFPKFSLKINHNSLGKLGILSSYLEITIVSSRVVDVRALMTCQILRSKDVQCRTREWPYKLDYDGFSQDQLTGQAHDCAIKSLRVCLVPRP